MTQRIEVLPLEFVGTGDMKGIQFEQMAKSKKAYLYKLTFADDPNPSFEVIVREFVAKMIDFESRTYSKTDFKEIYPRSGHFGKKGWAFKDYASAMKKFYELNVSMKARGMQ